ncbi:MAG TPA: DUF4114 domain-containing protein [Tepidisphaeraceae bacterium]|nr:DUF4114 domain-containing protein [Tepidisphaeraceae bacterium]
MRSAICYALAVVVSTCFVTASQAAITPLNSAAFGEDGHQAILSRVYGGTFVPTSPGSNDFTNGTITAYRVEDSYNAILDGPNPPSPLSPNYDIGNDDQLWTADFHSASAKAIFGDYHQEFGYYDGASGGTYHSLFQESGYGYDVNGHASLDGLPDGPIRWARGGEGRIFTSQASDNPDGVDHLITYRIVGLNNDKLTWLLLWEDLLPGEHPDYDYQDNVIQITACGGPPIAPSVPEPGSIALIVVAGLGLMRKPAPEGRR